MYQDFFGFKTLPFSIAPDPRYLYLSERHKEALAHLMYGVQGQGGFIVITGEVGTGKTTICRCFLESVPEHVDIALVVNPKLSARELLSSICDELKVQHPAGASIKKLIDLINQHLLDAHARSRHTVLIIDEAQNLTPDVLEQLRLLTNLETAEKKLLQIVLLGQPELNDMLHSQELRQLAQRVTARYHLAALPKDEVGAYLRYRLGVSGQRSEIFELAAERQLYRATGGIPRLLNLVSDRALLGAYAEGVRKISAPMIRQAAREVFGLQSSRAVKRDASSILVLLLLAMMAGGAWFWRVPLLTVLAPESSRVADEKPPLIGEIQRDPSVTLVPESASGLTGAGVASTPPASAPEHDIPMPVAVPAAMPKSPDAWLASVSIKSANLFSAYRAVFELWGFEVLGETRRTPCDLSESFGLRCLNRQGNWRSLVSLDHPAVLKLFTGDSQEFYAALLSVNHDLVRVSVAGQVLELTRDEVDAAWLGDYTLLWRLPPYESAVILPGEYVDQQAWLKQKINEVMVVKDPGQQTTLQGKPLTEWVRWYQRLSGLQPDGIAGTMTLIALSADTDASIPRLSTPTTLNTL